MPLSSKIIAEWLRFSFCAALLYFVPFIIFINLQQDYTMTKLKNSAPRLLVKRNEGLNEANTHACTHAPVSNLTDIFQPKINN